MKPDTVIENDPRAEEAIRRWDELKSSRSRHEQDWEDIANLMRPQRGGFGLYDHKRRQQEKPLSSEPIMALGSFAAGMYAALTNPANRWGGFETPDQELNQWRPMAEWNDLVTNRVLASFSPSVSGFYGATFQAYSDLAGFGNAAGYDQIDTVNRKFIDVTMSLAEVVVEIDAHGRVVEMVRKFTLKPRAAVREYGAKMLPKKVNDMADKGSSDDVTFYYHILNNDQFVKGKLGPRGKPWLGITACEEGRSLVKMAGHEDMPAYYPRWDVDSGMTYGTGPGMIALPSARMVNLMDGATIRAAQQAADPTRLAPDRQAVPLNGTFRPGSVVYGAVDMRGNQLIRNLEQAGNIGLTIEEKRAKTEAVKEAFHYAVMSLSGRTGVTEEETRIMEEARLRNWAPHADRIMEEYAARKFERRFRLLWRAGQLPPPPPEASGMPLRVRYQSAAAMAMRAREGTAIRQFIGDLGPLAQLNPRYVDRLEPDAIAEALHDASPSLPARILRSREDADEIAKARTEKEQQAQQMQMAEAAGGVAKDLGVTLGNGGIQ